MAHVIVLAIDVDLLVAYCLEIKLRCQVAQSRNELRVGGQPFCRKVRNELMVDCKLFSCLVHKELRLDGKLLACIVHMYFFLKYLYGKLLFIIVRNEFRVRL